jgi:hypothetical protein
MLGYASHRVAAPDQYETVPLMWTTGPFGPTVPWLLGLPVIPMNSPVPPMISPLAKKFLVDERTHISSALI